MRSTTSDLAREFGLLEGFLEELAATAAAIGTAAEGVVFLASSAGGIYGAGSAGTISETDLETPTTAYAVGKLAQEGLLAGFHAATGSRCLVGRITNVYGTTQNLAKSQGLVSHVCRATLQRAPLKVTVPLDTRRDYIHSADAGRRIRRWTQVARARPPSVTTKLIASGRSATVAEIIDGVFRVSGIRPPVVYAHAKGQSDSPRYQKFVSVVETDVDVATPCRSLVSGINDVWSATWRTFVRDGSSLPQRRR
jgi:UDP-glucose 4-epimerase